MYNFNPRERAILEFIANEDVQKRIGFLAGNGQVSKGVPLIKFIDDDWQLPGEESRAATTWSKIEDPENSLCWQSSPGL